MYIETTHDKDELELIVELVFKTQGLVGEGVVPTSLLQRHKQGCHVNMGSTHTHMHMLPPLPCRHNGFTERHSRRIILPLKKKKNQFNEKQTADLMPFRQVHKHYAIG